MSRERIIRRPLRSLSSNKLLLNLSDTDETATLRTQTRIFCLLDNCFSQLNSLSLFLSQIVDEIPSEQTTFSMYNEEQTLFCCLRDEHSLTSTGYVLTHLTQLILTVLISDLASFRRFRRICRVSPFCVLLFNLMTSR